MRHRLTTGAMMAASLVAALLLTTATPSGQAPYRAPRTKDGKPNLNGAWQAVNEANWDLEVHSAAPGPF